ncbi:30S ribosome-binding factor RbfA [Caenispirillum bisanense]|uniref:Ribosome-binding factor A n=1 Tax=Caenispirillum bisanense TaxID=414052 RepID=A0A286G915_9PROT|nr:30S ribosome-binding factor RbfA [Caenispirillum bisanense]SOD92043.1 ribosome-binding factor A [Caenispirillum bisanense]
MTRGRGKPPSQRQLRVGEEIRHALAWALERGDFGNAGLDRPVTVTEVRVSPDLRNATAFVTPLGGGDPKPVLQALRRIGPHLRHELARQMRMKYVPNLSFQADESFDEAQHINVLLHSPEVVRDLDHGPAYPDGFADEDEDEEGAEEGDEDETGEEADAGDAGGDRHGA